MQYREKRRIPVRLILALLVVAGSLISFYSRSSFNPVTGEKQHLGLTAEQEIALGLEAAPQMAREYGGESADPSARRMVAEIGNRLLSRSAAHETPYKYDFHLLADPVTINAFALPGGQVFITEGLYQKLTTRGELAGVLSHEMGHVAARHGAQQMAKAQLTQGLTGAAVLATYDPQQRNSQASAQIAMLVGQLVQMRYGRQDELQADQLGVRFSSEAGFDPRAMIGVMKILEKASQGRRTPEFFSTHPNPENRIGNIEEAIVKEFPNGVPEGLEK